MAHGCYQISSSAQDRTTEWHNRQVSIFLGYGLKLGTRQNFAFSKFLEHTFQPTVDPHLQK